jgi:aspartyl-tRNA(Asn)/glutamyl-tRNA(Gln) amidotransferase subunit B
MYDRPLGVNGYIEIEGDEGGEKRVRITRVHLEEDPGRLVHMGGGDRPRYSLADYNRSGIPLLEIVTDPDLRSPKEARRLLNILRATLEYLRVFDGDREGALRVDANISLEGYSRVEIKNISSYKGVEKALTFEITRQKSLIRRGQTVDRETRHFQEARGITTSSRSKEAEQDYRYFPEPDLRPLRVRDWVDRIVLPELPGARKDRFMAQYGISLNHARTLTGDLHLADLYEQVASVDPILSATWVADTLLGELYYRSMNIGDVPVPQFIELLDLLKKGRITDKGGVQVLRMMLDQAIQHEAVESPVLLVERLGLGKTAGDEFIPLAREVIATNPAAVQDYKQGKKGALNFLVGQMMKKTGGRADPRDLGAILESLIAGLPGD